MMHLEEIHFMKILDAIRSGSEPEAVLRRHLEDCPECLRSLWECYRDCEELVPLPLVARIRAQWTGMKNSFRLPGWEGLLFPEFFVRAAEVLGEPEGLIRCGFDGMAGGHPGLFYRVELERADAGMRLKLLTKGAQAVVVYEEGGSLREEQRDGRGEFEFLLPQDSFTIVAVTETGEVPLFNLETF